MVRSHFSTTSTATVLALLPWQGWPSVNWTFIPSPKDRLSSIVTYHPALRIFWAPSRLASPVPRTSCCAGEFGAAISCPRHLYLVRYLNIALLLRAGVV